jgi:hypothetical protein
MHAIDVISHEMSVFPLLILIIVCVIMMFCYGIYVINYIYEFFFVYDVIIMHKSICVKIILYYIINQYQRLKF